MATYRELVYIIVDLAKLMSDDTTINENHVSYLLDKYRAYLIEQKYKQSNSATPINNMQEMCFKVKLVPYASGCGSCMDDCLNDTSAFYRSINKLPNLLNVGNPIVSFIKYPKCKTYNLTLDTTWTKELIDEINDFFGKIVINPDKEGTKSKETLYSNSCKDEVEDIKRMLEEKYGIEGMEIDKVEAEDCEEFEGIKAHSYNNVSIVGRNRFQYVGTSKYMKNKIYGAIGADHYLYMKSSRENFYLPDTEDAIVFVNGVFEDPLKAAESSCNVEIGEGQSKENCIDSLGYNKCEPLDNTFPIEDSLISQLLSLVLNAIRQNIYNPRDAANNANDDLSSIEAFVRNYLKDRFVKRNEGPYEDGTA